LFGTNCVDASIARTRAGDIGTRGSLIPTKAVSTTVQRAFCE
jgi:hypothetical protein